MIGLTLLFLGLSALACQQLRHTPREKLLPNATYCIQATLYAEDDQGSTAVWTRFFMDTTSAQARLQRQTLWEQQWGYASLHGCSLRAEITELSPPEAVSGPA